MYAYGTKLHKRIFVLIMFAILYYSSPFHLDSGLKVISHQVTGINIFQPCAYKHWDSLAVSQEPWRGGKWGEGQHRDPGPAQVNHSLSAAILGFHVRFNLEAKGEKCSV